jgi:hypothetical protein
MPSLQQIGSVFTRYANLTLGGGSATTAVIHGEIVTKRRWVTEEQFGLSYALGRLTPGTNLLAFCVGIGWIDSTERDPSPFGVDALVRAGASPDGVEPRRDAAAEPTREKQDRSS